MAAAQLEVAKRWSMPIFRLWDQLNWSQEKIDARGKWSDKLEDGTYIWLSGTGVQRMTRLQVALPDQVHPSKDASGRANSQIAEVITEWFGAGVGGQ